VFHTINQKGIFIMLLSKKMSFSIVILLIFSGIYAVAETNTLSEDFVSSNEVIQNLPKEIENILKKNAEQLDKVSLIFRRTRTTQLPAEQLLKQIHCLYEYGFFEPSDHKFIWQSPCFYQYSSGLFSVESKTGRNKRPFAYEQGLNLIITSNENSFDGNEFMSGSDNDKAESSSAALGITSKEHFVRDFGKHDACDSVFLWASGYRFPRIGFDLGMSQQSLILHLTSNGRITLLKNDVMGDQPCIIVEIIANDVMSADERVFRFWLLPNLQYAVKKMNVYTVKGNVIYEIENTDFIDIDKKGVFFPKKSVINYYRWYTVPEFISDKILVIESYDLDSVTTHNISAIQFKLRKQYTTPGTVIADQTLRDTDAGVQYTIPANPADLDRVIEAALTGKDFVPTPLPSTTAIIFKWLLCIAGIAMIFYAGYKKFIKK
jgi:hypothetical protein